MPTAPARPCSAPGCPNTQRHRSGKCPECRLKAQRDYNRERRPKREPYDKRAWRDRFRPWFLRRNPLCVDCGGIATEVDHIKPLRDGGAMFDPENCRALCKPCHSRRTAEQVFRG